VRDTDRAWLQRHTTGLTSFSRVSFWMTLVTLSDSAKYSVKRSIARSLCDSWASCLCWRDCICNVFLTSTFYGNVIDRLWSFVWFQINTRKSLTTQIHCNTINYTELHCVPKKGSHLMFDNNFGKCRPIFKILSPVDSWDNYPCSYCKDFQDFHLTCNMLLHYHVKFKNPKM